MVSDLERMKSQMERVFNIKKYDYSLSLLWTNTIEQMGKHWKIKTWSTMKGLFRKNHNINFDSED